MECYAIRNLGKCFDIQIQNVFKNVFARTYTSSQIFKIGHLYNVLCTDSLPHYD